MLQRIEHPGGIVTYQSPLLRGAGIVHAFSTRLGGVSAAPFDTLNLGNPGALEAPERDAPQNLLENYRRLQHAIGAAHRLRASVNQVHGSRVELLEHEPENEYAETLEAEIRDRFAGQNAADAIVTAEPNVLLTVRVADCFPILLASPDGRLVAAVHAGWRGIVAGILENTVRAMYECGAAPPTLLAAIGPGISAEHFEVGDEVAAEFVGHDLAGAVHGSPGQKPHIDLQAAIATQLQRAGVTQIDTNDRCTFRDAAEFFSHRRDHGRTGRMAALIAASPNPADH